MAFRLRAGLTVEADRLGPELGWIGRMRVGHWTPLSQGSFVPVLGARFQGASSLRAS